MRSRSYSLRMRVYLLTGIALASFVGLVMVFLAASQFVSYQQMQEGRYIVRADNAREARSLLLQLDLLSVTYLSDRDEQLAEEFDTLSEEFLSKIEAVDGHNLFGSGAQFTPEAEILLEDLKATFEVRRRLGLTHDNGLEGRLRTAVHDVEARLDAFGDHELTAKMLMMRRHEKDFMMRLEPAYLVKHAQRMSEFLAILETRPYSEEDKAQLRALLEEYQTGFAEWSDARTELAILATRTEKRFNDLVTRISRYSDDALLEAKLLTAKQKLTLHQAMIVTAVVVLLFVVMSLVITWKVGKSIEKPLRKVARNMLAICEERADDEIDFTGESRNEIEHLQNVVSFFEDQLAESDKLHEEVRYHRDNLKAEVSKRTMQLEEQTLKLEQALCHEKELNELQNQFVSIVSHEFRTPLTIIDAMARRVAKKADVMSVENIRERMDNIRFSTSRLAELVERTLDSSRLANGEMQFSPEVFDFRGLVRDVLARHREIAPDYEFVFQDNDQPCVLNGDERLLDHVVSNLVSNAIKYSKKNPKIIVGLECDQGETIFRVRDHGVGIPKSELQHITKRFFRASTAKGIKGTGIGLNLVASLIEMHKGNFEIDSVEGEWTEVVVRLPIQCECLHKACCKPKAGEADVETAA